LRSKLWVDRAGARKGRVEQRWVGGGYGRRSDFPPGGGVHFGEIKGQRRVVRERGDASLTLVVSFRQTSSFAKGVSADTNA